MNKYKVGDKLQTEVFGEVEVKAVYSLVEKNIHGISNFVYLLMDGKNNQFLADEYELNSTFSIFRLNVER